MCVSVVGPGSLLRHTLRLARLTRVRAPTRRGPDIELPRCPRLARRRRRLLTASAPAALLLTCGPRLCYREGGTFLKSTLEGGKFSPLRQISLPRCGREDGRTGRREDGKTGGREDGEWGNATPATDRPQPSSPHPTFSPNPMSLASLTSSTEISAPSAQQEPLEHTDEGIRQLAENREKNYREKQSVDASIVLGILEQEAETDG